MPGGRDQIAAVAARVDHENDWAARLHLSGLDPLGATVDPVVDPGWPPIPTTRGDAFRHRRFNALSAQVAALAAVLRPA